MSSGTASGTASLNVLTYSLKEGTDSFKKGIARLLRHADMPFTSDNRKETLLFELRINMTYISTPDDKLKIRMEIGDVSKDIFISIDGLYLSSYPKKQVFDETIKKMEDTLLMKTEDPLYYGTQKYAYQLIESLKDWVLDIVNSEKYEDERAAIIEKRK